jgi:hypothetical protein
MFVRTARLNASNPETAGPPVCALAAKVKRELFGELSFEPSLVQQIPHAAEQACHVAFSTLWMATISRSNSSRSRAS